MAGRRYGVADREISPQMVMRLYAKARAPKAIWIVPGAHHGDYSVVAPAEYARRLSDFYARELAALPRSNIQSPAAE